MFIKLGACNNYNIVFIQVGACIILNQNPCRPLGLSGADGAPYLPALAPEDGLGWWFWECVGGPGVVSVWGLLLRYYLFGGVGME